MASILILGGVIPLASAIIAQYGLGLAPCHFCLLQRYPYILPILAGALLLLLPRMDIRWRFCVALGLFGFFVTGMIGLIHSGIESGYLHYTGGCVAQSAADASLEAIRAAIANAPLVACNEVRASFLGFSMASWNSFWAAAMIMLTALQYRFERRTHGQ